MDRELRNLGSNYWRGTAPGMRNASATGTDFSQWSKSNDVEMATRQFEGAGKPHLDKRISAAKSFYSKYANGGSGGGFGEASISKRKLNKITNKNNNKGGRGNVDYKSSSSIQNTKYSSGYDSANRASDYINTTKESGISELLLNAIEILAAIAGNTSDTSKKLNALKDLQKLGGSNNNIIVNGKDTSNNKFNNPNPTSLRNNTSKKDITARQIAQGGY